MKKKATANAERTKKSAEGRDRTMVQTAIWLPRDMHERLKAEGGERGLGEEIRRRLEASFEHEPADEQTARLLEAVSSINWHVASDYGAWHTNAFSFQIFKAGLNILLERFQPKGLPVAKPLSGGLAEVVFSADDTPEDIAKSYAVAALQNLKPTKGT